MLYFSKSGNGIEKRIAVQLMYSFSCCCLMLLQNEMGKLKTSKRLQALFVYGNK